MGWVVESDPEMRRTYLGSWAGDTNIDLLTRNNVEFFARVSNNRTCSKGGFCDYRYMVGPDPTDVGGYVCIPEFRWGSETAERSCDAFSPLTCRYCGDVY